ncbi:type IV secretion system protein [Kineosporia babensis]|uniref:TrbL/VirB6 plasmid conjugal transfer protein n=1 Tax=Kineosporia babensis TaxID=499548 RepID=A0A9X1NL13_9ACTN|nr:conjugal transfer protein TrbL family protein [Kineosporia babensis]MCD5316972.1 hypothetical protein [Kineosporia babensis]
MGDWLVQEVLEYFVRAVLEPLPHLLMLVSTFVVQIPVVTEQWPVRYVMERSLGIVQVSYVVLVTVAGIVTMTHGGLQSEYSAKALLQRAVLGFTAAHYTGWIVEKCIVAVNALSGALLPQGELGLSGLDASEAMVQQIARAPETVFLLLALQFVVLALLVVLLIGWVTRLLSLAMLAGLGPLALACHGLPWLEEVATVWWRSLFAILITVVGQAALLQFGMQLLLAPELDPSWATEADRSDAVTTLLLILCLLLAVIRLPATVRQVFPAAVGPRGRGTFGTVVRYSLLNRGLRSGSRQHSLAGAVQDRLSHRFQRRQSLRTAGDDSRLQDRPATGWRPGVLKRSRVRTPTDADVLVRRQRMQRRAVLAGRSVSEPGQQSPRIAGNDKTSQRTGALTLLGRRKRAPGQPQPGGSARLAPRPRPGRTAGNPTAVSTPSVRGSSRANNGRLSVRRRDRAGQSRSRVSAPGNAGPRPQNAARSNPRPVTRSGTATPGGPTTVSRTQRAVNGGPTGQTAARRHGQPVQPRRPQRPLRPFTAQANRPVRLAGTRRARSRPAEND